MREVKRPDYNFMYVHRSRDLLEIDLMDLQQLASRNKNFKYYLCVIDAFSRKAWAEPIKAKTPALVRNAFEKILDRMERAVEVRRIHCDDGNEWKGAFDAFLRQKGIERTIATRHAHIVERLQRTLKSLLSKHMAQYETVNHLEAMPHVLQTYNGRHHRSINTTPNLGDLSRNALAVRYAMSINRADRMHRQLRKKEKFKEGDLVRIQRRKHTFQRSFHPTFTTEIFKISKVHRSLPEPMYSVKMLDDDDDDEPLPRRRYSTELQKVDLEEFKISKVHWGKKRTNPATGQQELFVEFAGLPKSFGAYIPKVAALSRTKQSKKPWGYQETQRDK